VIFSELWFEFRYSKDEVIAMACVQIPDENREIREPAEIKAFLSQHGIEFEPTRPRLSGLRKPTDS